jgi:glycosyltransferase involved in cell wall biosynthesis
MRGEDQSLAHVPALSQGIAGDSTPLTIWFEVEDFLKFFDEQPKAAGIQRVQMELFAQFQRMRRSDTTIRYCRLNRFSHRLNLVAYADLERAFHDPPLAYPDDLALWVWRPFRARLRLMRRWLRDAADVLSRLGFDAWRLFGGQAHNSLRLKEIRPGDILVCTGTSWSNSQYGRLIAASKRECGVTFMMLIHDIIPITHPQYSMVAAGFRRWVDAMLRIADAVLTDSRYSQDSLVAHAREIGLESKEVSVLRLGADFSAAPPSTPNHSRDLLALPRPFVLFVSTLEIRKNHGLLVRVWRRLIERHGSDAVPGLVFVGARGWLIGPLLAELAATSNLGGKVRILSGISDAELQLCYRYCLLTAYPSFVEGWGLPVAESLQYGKVCVASNRGPLPEVGGELVDYFDPDDEDEALAVFERAIFDDEYRQMREARIRAEYRAPGWEECAESLLRAALRAARKQGDAAVAAGIKRNDAADAG